MINQGEEKGDMFIVNYAENKTTFLPSDGERSFDEVTYNGRFKLIILQMNQIRILLVFSWKTNKRTVGRYCIL